MVSLTKLDIILVIFVFLVTFFVSTIFGIILFFFLLLVKKRFTAPFFFYVIFVISLISFTQYSRWSTTNYDMVGYYTVYDFFSHANFSEVLFFIFKKGDIFFYFLVWVLSKIFPDDPRMLGFFMPFITSYLALLTIKNFRKKIGVKKYFTKLDLFLWCISFFLILSFLNYTNIYRQFLSVSLLIYAISRKALGQRFIVFIILSALSHWSSIILIILYFLFEKLQKEDFKILFLMPVLGIFSTYILMALPLPEQAKYYLFGNEILGVDKTLIVTGTVIQIILYRYYLDYKNKFNEAYVISFMILAYNFFFIVNSTLLTRNFYVVTYFLVISMVSFIDNKKMKTHLFIPIIIITIFINTKQFISAEFFYEFFSKKQYLLSAVDIFKTPFPLDIIR